MTGLDRAVLWSYSDNSQPPDSLNQSSFITDGIHLEPPAGTVSQMAVITFSEMTWAAAIESNVDLFVVTCYSYFPFTLEDQVIPIDLVASPTLYEIYIVCK